MEAANIMMDSISEEHISYALAPRLNSIGRLGDANPIVNFFCSNDLQEIHVMASYLEGLNIHRRLIVDQVIHSAIEQIEKNPELIKKPVLILENHKWPGGIIGIAASRMVELYHLPTILLSINDEGLARGSARSIEGINITQALEEQADMLDSFGGHPMAAGLSLKAENIPDFRRCLGASIIKMTTGMELTPQLQIHSYLELSDISSPVVDALELLAPYGPGNPIPVLVSKDLSIKSRIAIGKTEDHSQLILQDKTGQQHKVIWWQSSALPMPDGRFDLAYSIRKSNYRGKEEIQIQWVDFRQIEPAGLATTSSKPEVQIIDMRSSGSQEVTIQSLVKELDALVWAEGIAQFQFPCVNRLNLKPTLNLVIASIPPSIHVLTEILTFSRPKTIYLFKFDSENDQIQIFLQQLSGLVLYTINHRGGWLIYKEVAAKLCHTEKSVQTGIEWLIANGTIQVSEHMGETICIRRDGTRDDKALPAITKHLNDLLKETRAYRSYTLFADHKIWLDAMDSLETGKKPGNS
jgi:single-stranded-DNA-specific exonuclease